MEVDTLEERFANIQINYAGGNASKNAKNYKISLPSSWIKKLGINEKNKGVFIQFDGETILIRKKESQEYKVFKSMALNHGHNFVILHFYHEDVLCTKICADYTIKRIAIQNEVDDIFLTAFGVNGSPSWNDYEDFLKDRCIQKDRDGMKFYLKELGLEEYNPLEIIRKSKGKMAEDKYWIKILWG